MSERGQVYTLEGIFAALVVVLSVLFAIQTSAGVAGPSASGAPERDSNHVRHVVTELDETALRTAALSWSSQEDGFHCSPDEKTFYAGSATTGTCSLSPGDPHSSAVPPNALGTALEAALGEQYRYNVIVRYHTTGAIERQRMVFQGQPGDEAVRSRTTVLLENDDQFRDASGAPTGTRLRDDPDRLYAPPSDGDATDDDPYNLLGVEVVVWRP